MTSSPFRVIVVDDFEPWRNFVCSTLQEHSQSWLVSEASDGLEAVRQAHELQPDLIVLDIGLPKLHGIEAARRIRDNCPETKILFLTERRSVEIVQEALRLGASGYIVKSDAVELLAAVEAIRQNRTFLSKSLAAAPLDFADRGFRALRRLTEPSCQALLDDRVQPSPSASTRSSRSGTSNSANPQFRQTRTFGKAHTEALSKPSHPGK